MNKGLGFLKVDIVLQQIIGGIYLFTMLLGIITPGAILVAMLLQLALGGWQLISTLTHSINGHVKSRTTYIASVLCYFIVLIIGSLLIANNMIRENTILFVLGLIIIPIILAVWYLIISKKDYKERSRGPIHHKAYAPDMEDILDSEEIL